MLAAKYQMPRFAKGKAHPKFLKGDPAQLNAAETLVEILPTLVGESKEVVEQSLLGITELNPKIGEGLAQLLIGICTFEQADSKAAAQLRQRVFDQSAAYWKNPHPEASTEGHRAQIAKTLDGLPEDWQEDANHLLFGDLPSNQRLLSTPELTTQGLIDRYNLAQAQGLLIQAQSIELEVIGQTNIGQLLQMLKFFGLLFIITTQSTERLVIQVDGPTSVLETSRSYGVELANFFPAVLNLKGVWRLTAPVKVAGKKGLFTFECSHLSKYRSHYPKRTEWAGERLIEVQDRFNQKYGPSLKAQCTNRLMTLKNGQNLLPDLCLKAGKKEVWVQWLRHLSPAKKKWLLEIKQQLPKNYLIVFKGKVSQHQTLLDQMAPNLFLFSSQLTAPALKKIFEAT